MFCASLGFAFGRSAPIRKCKQRLTADVLMNPQACAEE